MNLKKSIPNLITALRIVFSAALIFTDTFSAEFFALYFAAGISDMLDGFLARKFSAESAFGSKLDSAADFVLAAACILKLYPLLAASDFVIWGTAAVFLLKVAAALSGLIMHKKLVFLHTAANKTVGLLLFVAVPAMRFIPMEYIAALLIPAAAFAAVQEGHFIRSGKTE